MITTETGAKKIEDSDNWREIFDAHNESVDALNSNIAKLQNELGIVCDGNKCTVSATTGQYIILKNSTISGCADGLYTAAQAIPANTAITSAYLAAVSNGGLNALNSKLENYNGITLTPAENVTINTNKTETIIAGRLVFMRLCINTTATKPAWADLVLTSINVNQTPARMFNGDNLAPLTTTVYMDGSRVRLATEALPTGRYVIEVIAIKG